jgi:hypothetical protein
MSCPPVPPSVADVCYALWGSNWDRHLADVIDVLIDQVQNRRQNLPTGPAVLTGRKRLRIAVDPGIWRDTSAARGTLSRTPRRCCCLSTPIDRCCSPSVGWKKCPSI